MIRKLILALSLALCSMSAASATCSLAYPGTPALGSIASPTVVWANYNALLACINGISGGGLFTGQISTPTLTNFTAVNASYTGAAFSQVSTGINFYAPTQAGNDNIALVYQTAALPSPPWTTTVLIANANGTRTNSGMALYDSGSGNLMTWGPGFTGTPAYENMQLLEYTSVTTYHGFVTPYGSAPLLYWLRIQNDGTLVHFEYSIDGVAFIDVNDQAFTYLGTYQVPAFFCDPYNDPCSETLMSWSVTTP